MSEVPVICNPLARAGRVKSMKDLIREALASAGLRPGSVLMPGGERSESQITDFLSAQFPGDSGRLIAFGGDGTLNHLINVFLRWCRETGREPRNFCFGAVGTGSSNDFHKPVGKRFRGFPVRLNFASPVCQDLIRIRTAEGFHYGINNLGIGFTADANHQFNHPGAILTFLKKLSPDVAVFWTALHGLRALKTYPVLLSCDGRLWQEPGLNNLGVVKNRHIAGMFRYPSLVQGDDGCLGLYVIRSCGPGRFLRVLAGLVRGRFPDGPHRMSLMGKKICFQSGEEMAWEVDGEVFSGRFLELEAGAIQINFAG